MKRTYNFAKRNFKELVRDPLGLVFAIILPLFLLFIFQQFNIPNAAYQLENFTPGIIVFGYSFITLFTATLVSKDRSTSLLIRLGTSPMRASHYILGYLLALLPIILTQNILFGLLAVILGLPFSGYLILAMLAAVVVAVMYIAMGILIGCLVSEKAASGVSSIIVQLVCFTSGMYFPKAMLGKGFGTVCDCLPFAPGVNIVKAIMNNNFGFVSALDLVVFGLYTVAIMLAAIIVFRRKLQK